MHPELSLQMAMLRHSELTNPGRFRHAADRAARRRFFRRRRHTHLAAPPPPPPLVLLPPPREERDPTAHDLVA